jgi:hypothetical protein
MTLAGAKAMANKTFTVQASFLITHFHSREIIAILSKQQLHNLYSYVKPRNPY